MKKKQTICGKQKNPGLYRLPGSGKKRILALTAAAVLMLTPLVSYAAGTGINPVTEEQVSGPGAFVLSEAEEKALLKNNYYEAYNGKLLASKEIPADSYSWSWFYQLDQNAYQKLDAILKESVANKASALQGSETQWIADLYLTAMDNDGRNAHGMGELRSYLDRIESSRTIPEYLDALRTISHDLNVSSFLTFGSMQDPEDPGRYVVGTGDPDLGPGKEVLEDSSMTEQQDAYKRMTAKLFKVLGNPEPDAAAEQIYRLEKDLASYAYRTEQKYDMSLTYNVYSRAELRKLLSNAETDAYLDALGFGSADEVIVECPPLMKRINALLTSQNLPLLKQYSEVVMLMDYGDCTTIPVRDILLDYSNEISGIKERKTDEKLASELTQGMLGFEFGKLYAAENFSAEAKQNVEKTVRDLLAAYEKRIDAIDWMGVETKKEAKKKLSTMGLMIGYPDQWPEYYKGAEVRGKENGGYLIDNVISLEKAAGAYSREIFAKPVDRKQWYMTPQTVNAYYDPSNNQIVFPAAILQAPFYSAGASYEKNLGGIGAVIGHELSHAFDSSGAQYDEAGKYHVWWTDEDYQKFEEKTKAIADYYSTVPSINGKYVNGELTLTENIADLGGVAVATSLLNGDPVRLRTFFRQYATIWAEKITDEAQEQYLLTDVHSPSIVRVNEVLKNTDAFYTAYPELKEGDGMYLAPEKRVGIW